MKAFAETLFYSQFSQNLLLSRKFLLFLSEGKRECPNASAYERQLKENKGMIKSFDMIKNINVHFTMVYVVHKNRKFGEKEYRSDNHMDI